MTDEVFSIILDGIIGQCEFDQDGNMSTQYIQSIVYSAGEIGYKSLKRLLRFIPNMVEIFLNNVTFMGYRNDQEGIDIRPQDIKI